LSGFPCCGNESHVRIGLAVEGPYLSCPACCRPTGRPTATLGGHPGDGRDGSSSVAAVAGMFPKTANCPLSDKCQSWPHLNKIFSSRPHPREVDPKSFILSVLYQSPLFRDLASQNSAHLLQVTPFWPPLLLCLTKRAILLCRITPPPRFPRPASSPQKHESCQIEATATPETTQP